MSSTTHGHTRAVEALPESDRHRLLRNERRRTVLDVLASRTSGIGLEELATEVAEREVSSDDPGSAVRERVLISLYHRHLPLMAELGTVTHDRETGRVESRL